MTREQADAIADIVVKNELAVTWSQRIDGDDKEAGKKGRGGWNFAAPQKDRDFLSAHLVSYHGKRNLLVVTAHSNVITIDCDTPAGLDYYASFDLPTTLAVKSGRGDGGMHFIHRPPEENLPITFFELAGEPEGKVTGISRNKLHVIAGIHKTGREYEIYDHEITPLPLEVYETLSKGYVAARPVRQDNGGIRRVEHPGRHDFLLERTRRYFKEGHRAAALVAHVRVDWDYYCEQEPADPGIDAFIERYVARLESKE